MKVLSRNVHLLRTLGKCGSGSRLPSLYYIDSCMVPEHFGVVLDHLQWYVRNI